MQLERILRQAFCACCGGAEKESRAGGEASTTDRPKAKARESLSPSHCNSWCRRDVGEPLQAELEQERLLSQQLATASKDLQGRARAIRSLMTLELCCLGSDLAIAQHVATVETRQITRGAGTMCAVEQQPEGASFEIARATLEAVAVLGTELAALEARPRRHGRARRPQAPRLCVWQH